MGQQFTSHRDKPKDMQFPSRTKDTASNRWTFYRVHCGSCRIVITRPQILQCHGSLRPEDKTEFGSCFQNQINWHCIGTYVCFALFTTFQTTWYRRDSHSFASLQQDELQRDLMQERWDLVEKYPAVLRSYVPVFTTYTDAAFPTDAPTDKGLRVALRYEVGRFFASLERFKGAVQRRSLDAANIAYSEMSLHFDRYMRVGGIYTYYDATVSLETYFQGIADEALVYADPQKDPPLVRDLVIFIKGPDKGRTGIVIGKYEDGSEKTVVKLDRYQGMREIRVVSNAWVAKRLGEQDPDDVFLMSRRKYRTPPV